MKFLLVTDLDNTLVGDQQATFALNQHLGVRRDSFYLIYATGRSYRSALELKEEQQLLEPDYWVTGVGTEIYHQGTRDLTWAEQLSCRWNRTEILTITQSFPQLLPQAREEQNPWKISFCLSRPEGSSILEDLNTELEQTDSAAQIVFSSGKDVDIIPAHADKGLALTYLRQHLGMRGERTLACGDSGNDISLFQQATLGLIVSNAQAELLDWYDRNSDGNVYLANSAYAWGILEGLSYFNLLPLENRTV